MNKLKLFAQLSQGKCLDIGFAQKPNPHLQDPVGIDIQNVAKPENYKKVFVVNLNKDKLPFEDNSFDTIIAGDVIEHVENPSYLLREINRVLKEKGIFLLSTPQANHWWTTIHNWFFSSFVNDPDEGEHLSNWTILDMKRLLKLNGFQVKKLWGTECYIPKINITIPILRYPRLGWIIIYETKKIAKPEEIIYSNYNTQKIKLKKEE